MGIDKDWEFTKDLIVDPNWEWYVNVNKIRNFTKEYIIKHFDSEQEDWGERN